MFSPERALLLVIDIQGRLARRMFNKEMLFKNIQRLIQAARYLKMPVVFTEQAPEKIGKTISAISKYFDGQRPVVKSSFSCCGQSDFLKKLKAFKKKQIIVTGIETHVCVYQTCADLMNLHYAVEVVADAVSSRQERDTRAALERIKSLGGMVTTTEMIICELLKTSQHKKFREIINLIK